jgi:predicted Rossmann fold nucleotide-binding protein DprA/Smf involved in DNA uptake
MRRTLWPGSAAAETSPRLDCTARPHLNMPHHLRQEVTCRGSLDLLQEQMLALFCSARCPGNLILRTYDLVRELRDRGISVAGGFHSPMEHECLTLLLRGEQPIVICPARSLEGMRIPPEWRQPLEAGRLLLLSPFPPAVRRITAATALARNRFVASVADRVFVAHAAPGSKTEVFCREVLSSGKPLLTFEAEENKELFKLGALPLRLDDLTIAEPSNPAPSL